MVRVPSGVESTIRVGLLVVGPERGPWASRDGRGVFYAEGAVGTGIRGGGGLRYGSVDRRNRKQQE